jgi:uncharacterized protein (UPF0332 family)
MDPRRFLDLSRRLLSGAAPSPEDFRSAISRAYYAAFHVAVDALRVMSLPPGKASAVHGETARLLGGCKDKKIQSSACSLSDLHGRRVQADYHLEKTEPEIRQQAETAERMAREIITEIDSLMGDSGRVQAAKKEISEYAKSVLKKPFP